MKLISLNRLAFALRLFPFAIIMLFVLHPKAITWMPMSRWMGVFLIGIVIWAAIELRLRYRQIMNRVKEHPTTPPKTSGAHEGR